MVVATLVLAASGVAFRIGVHWGHRRAVRAQVAHAEWVRRIQDVGEYHTGPTNSGPPSVIRQSILRSGRVHSRADVGRYGERGDMR